MSESLHPFEGELPHKKKALPSYDAQGAVEYVAYVGCDLYDFIQHLEAAVAAEIIYGVTRRIESHTYKRKGGGGKKIMAPHRRQFKATPKLIRTRNAKMPMPEARSWVYHVLNHHPDTTLTAENISIIYNRSSSLVRRNIKDVSYQIRANEKVRLCLQAVLNELEAAGYSACEAG